VLGPGMFSATFAYYIKPEHLFPGAPWFLASFLLLASLLLAWFIAPEQFQSPEPSQAAL
jgi:hypothetical protein